jgi:hypothetical protein
MPTTTDPAKCAKEMLTLTQPKSASKTTTKEADYMRLTTRGEMHTRASEWQQNAMQQQCRKMQTTIQMQCTSSIIHISGRPIGKAFAAVPPWQHPVRRKCQLDSLLQMHTANAHIVLYK